MKHKTTSLLALSLALALILPLHSLAQKKSFDTKSPAWWSQLERQLDTSLKHHVDQVLVNQYIIACNKFFGCAVEDADVFKENGLCLNIQ